MDLEKLHDELCVLRAQATNTQMPHDAMKDISEFAHCQITNSKSFINNSSNIENNVDQALGDSNKMLLGKDNVALLVESKKATEKLFEVCKRNQNLNLDMSIVTKREEDFIDNVRSYTENIRKFMRELNIVKHIASQRDIENPVENCMESFPDSLCENSDQSSSIKPENVFCSSPMN